MVLVINSYDSKLRKPLMLKDYLLDDLSSCSSGGFRSFPRRECCVTLRLLLEIDFKSTNQNQTFTSKSSATMSKFKLASETVLKLLPFAAVKPQLKQSKTKSSSILPRSFSRKLLKRRFWKKTENYVAEEREDAPPPVFSPSAASTVTTSTDEKSNSWSDSDFTADFLQSRSGDLESSPENDVVEDKTCLPEEVVSKRVGVIVGDDSIEETTTASNSECKWPHNQEEKEQFSPVSVLDCPFEDDDDDQEEVSSPFQCRLARMEGTKQKLMQKIRRFENLAQLEPVDLEKQFSLSESTDESSADKNIILESIEEKNYAEHKALDLLELIKATMIPSSSFKFTADNLLLDFFRDEITDNFDDNQLINVAKGWVNGSPREMFLGWEMQQNREVYIRDMENGGKWSNLDEHKEEVALELEAEVFTSLVNELFLDVFSS